MPKEKKKKQRGRRDDKAPKERFFSRELSWIAFNERVLAEALDAANPLLERLKFLSIVSSNFDEFFMVRVAGLRRQRAKGRRGSCPSGMTPTMQLREIGLRVRQVVHRQYECLVNDLLPGLRAARLQLVRLGAFSGRQLEFMRDVFEREIFPVLTPMRMIGDGKLPFTVNLRLYIAFRLKAPARAGGSRTKTAVVQIPASLDRIRAIPGEDQQFCVALTEEIVIANARLLFRGHDVLEYAVFRVTRDADLGVDEEADDDFVAAMENVLVSRRRSAAVRLEISSDSPDLAAFICQSLGLEDTDVFEINGPLDLTAFMPLTMRQGFEHLRNKEWKPQWPRDIPEDADLWELLRRRDVLLHHPYESFDPIVRMISHAADDPAVLAIKMTLYRTSGESPIIESLTRAAQNGKQVTVIVELKARFDEEKNIGWAHLLEQAGAIIIYGIAALKVHSKATLITRREDDGVRSYVHLGTGNYNDKTARLYTDMGLMTSQRDLAHDTIMFFNAVTGYTEVPNLRKLLMAPTTLKDRLVHLIDREAHRSSPEAPGLIMAKLNSLADPDVIRALYRASNAGVFIKLNIRGICLLVPEVKGMSRHITVVSIVDRYLEHSRIAYFANGGTDEVYLSSADWMPRNLEKRVELMFPVEQSDLKQRLVAALNVFFSDNVKAHVLKSSGEYQRVRRKNGEPAHSSQEFFHREATTYAEESRGGPKRQFRVRRKPPRISRTA